MQMVLAGKELEDARAKVKASASSIEQEIADAWAKHEKVAREMLSSCATDADRVQLWSVFAAGAEEIGKQEKVAMELRAQACQRESIPEEVHQWASDVKRWHGIS